MTPLDGGKVRLRDFSENDLDDVAAIIGDDRVTHWLAFDSRSRDGAASMIAAAMDAARIVPRTEFYLASADSSTDRVIGFGRLALGGIRSAKLGYAIHADHWGQGYATATARTLVEFGFGELGLHRITAAVGPENQRSARVLERLGFRPEGRLRDHVHTNGAWRDSLLYSLLEHEH